MVTKERAQALWQIASEHGTPCYVYFLEDIARRVADVRSAFGSRLRISYAMKANPHAQILAHLIGKTDTIDISSAGELRRALEAGWTADKLSFTGPGKQEWELEAAVRERIAEVVVESVEEAALLDAIAAKAGIRQAILIRIAPQRVPRGLGVNMAGRPSQFGVDEEHADEAIRRIKEMANLEIVGMHIFSGTQCLDASSIVENYQIYIEIFTRLSETHELAPRKLIFGSSLGIPYHPGDTALDLNDVAARTNPMLDELRAHPSFKHAEFFLETGRYLVGEAGVYLTKVVRRKTSRGVEIGICDGGMNHHLAACGHLGSVLHRNYPIFRLENDSPPTEDLLPFDLVGPMCTSIDTLGRNVKLPGLEVGDVIMVLNSGAYGLTASPNNFISHPNAREVIVAGASASTVDNDRASRLAAAPRAAV